MCSQAKDHIDLFSGIGGFALAARWAGFETVQFVELDPFCQKVLQKNFPGVPIHGDIKTFKWITQNTIGTGTGGNGGEVADKRGRTGEGGGKGIRQGNGEIGTSGIGATDQHESTKDSIDQSTPFILTGGFPCQPFSCAGKRKGKDDDRYLWPEMLRVISEARPAWVIGENVGGFVNMGLDECISGLEAEGYEVQPFIIPACAKNAPHRRDRVWIVANCRQQRKGGEERRFSCGEQPGQTENERTGKGNGLTNKDSHAPYSNSHGTGERYNSDNLRKDTGAIQQGGDCTNKENEGGDLDNSNRNVTDTYGSGDRTPRSGADSNGQEKDEGRRELTQFKSSRQGWQEPWLEAATRLCRVDARVSGRVDRLKSLGNAIVPQIAYEIMKAIKEIEEGEK